MENNYLLTPGLFLNLFRRGLEGRGGGIVHVQSVWIVICDVE
jgi:hypothetical protein